MKTIVLKVVVPDDVEIDTFSHFLFELLLDYTEDVVVLSPEVRDATKEEIDECQEQE